MSWRAPQRKCSRSISVTAASAGLAAPAAVRVDVVGLQALDRDDRELLRELVRTAMRAGRGLAGAPDEELARLAAIGAGVIEDRHGGRR